MTIISTPGPVAILIITHAHASNRSQTDCGPPCSHTASWIKVRSICSHTASKGMAGTAGVGRGGTGGPGRAGIGRSSGWRRTASHEGGCVDWRAEEHTFFNLI